MHRFKRLEQQLPPVAGDHDRGHGGALASGHVRDAPVGRPGWAGRAPGGVRATATQRCAAGARPGSGC
jgi:hypothetical protein